MSTICGQPHEAQVRSEAAADRAENRVDEAINNGAALVRDEVKQDADRAVAARQAATQSESNAAASETAAASSASNAAASESAAKQSETNAGDYAAVATTAATEAKNAMERATDLAGGDFATHEYVDQKVSGEKWERPTFTGDLNDLTELGVRSVTSSATNRPSGSEGTIEVVPTGSGSGVYQQYTESGSQALVYGRKISAPGATPTDWQVIADQAYRLKQLYTIDLNEAVTPGYFAQHLTGNATTSRNYPINRRGVLMVAVMGSGLISQSYFTPRGAFCRERAADGTWLEWGSLAGELTGVQEVVGQSIKKSSPETSLVTYGRTQPDPWVYPDTDLYWNGPNGTRFFPSGYPGSGYVGAIGTSAGYTNMVVEKGASDNIYVSAVNPTTGRHVTWMVEGKGADDMPIVGGIWIGGMTAEGRASRDTQLTRRSNMEYAIRINVDGVEQYVPWHGDNTAIAAGPTVFTDSSGNVIDMDAAPYTTALTGFDGFKVHQDLWGRHPVTGDRNLLKIRQVSTFSPDGLFRSETHLTVLETTRIEGMSIGNVPINAGFAETFHVWGGGSHAIPAGTGSYQKVELTGVENNFESGMFTGPNNIFAAVSLLDPDSTRADNASWLRSPGQRWIQIRPDGFVKFYQRSVGAGQDLPVGLSWAFGAEWRYGEAVGAALLPRPAEAEPTA